MNKIQNKQNLGFYKAYGNILGNASIGIITPYKQQEKQLKLRLMNSAALHNKDIEAATVDFFQGRERDIIVFSCVRASGKGIGFLADIRRMNVAITRAKYALWIVGNKASLQQNRDWKALMDDAMLRHCFRNVNLTQYRQKYVSEMTGNSNVSHNNNHIAMSNGSNRARGMRQSRGGRGRGSRARGGARGGGGGGARGGGGQNRKGSLNLRRGRGGIIIGRGRGNLQPNATNSTLNATMNRSMRVRSNIPILADSTTNGNGLDYGDSNNGWQTYRFQSNSQTKGTNVNHRTNTTTSSNNGMYGVSFEDI